MAERKAVDWEAIEANYRAGALSVSEIGRLQGISHTAINKRAKREGWTRSIVERVRELVSTRLVSDGVSAATARETVEAAASRVVQLVREHRQDIAKGRSIVQALMTELETDGKASASLKDRASIAASLTGSLKTVIGMEREAFGMQPEAPAAIFNNTNNAVFNVDDGLASIDDRLARAATAAIAAGDA